MEWLWTIIGLMAAVGIGAWLYCKTADFGFTAGKGMFKNSKYNIEENNKDFSDVNYYDNKGKLK